MSGSGVPSARFEVKGGHKVFLPCVVMMGIVLVMTARQRLFLFTVVVMIVGLLGALTVFSVKDTFLREDNSPSPTFFFSPLVKEPVVLEKEVPAAHVEANGRNYTSADVLDLLEAKGFKAVSFGSWIRHLMNTAEGQISFTFNGEVYSAREYEIEDVESDDCAVEFDHGGFEDGVVLCGNVEIETEDFVDLICSIEIFFERSSRYEHGKIKNCIVDLS